MRRLPLAGKRLFLIIAIALKYELCIVLLVNYYTGEFILFESLTLIYSKRYVRNSRKSRNCTDAPF